MSFTMEQSKTAYRADFALYGLAVVALATTLGLTAPRAAALEALGLSLLGLTAWTLMEYGLHRFVLHGLQPFRRWHAEHHRRPTALIGASTLLSATLFTVLVFLPTLAWGGPWRACALTLGVAAGYLIYTITHHATHHVEAGNGWLQRRRRWHLQHHQGERTSRYGVTSSLWDHAFGSAGWPRAAGMGPSAPQGPHALPPHRADFANGQAERAEALEGRRAA